MPANDSDPLAVLSGFADTSASAVSDLKRSVSHDTLRDAVRLIGTAKRIAVAGMKSAVPVASHLADGLGRLGYARQLLESVGPLEIERVSRMGADDVLVAVSLTESACPVMKLVAAAREHRVPVIGITGSAANPLRRHCDLHFVVRSPTRHDVQPLAAHMVLVQTLLMALEDERTRGTDEPRSRR